MCEFCYDKQPLKNSEQIQQVVSEIKMLQLLNIQFCEK